MAQNSIKAIPLSTFSCAEVLLGTYRALNAPNGFPNGICLLRIVNDNTEEIYLSYDGVTDHEYVAANSSVVLNFQTNAQPSAQYALMPATTVVWVRGTPGTGLITMSGYYC